MTTTKNEALEAMLTHHEALQDGVSRRVDALRSTVAQGGAHEPPSAGLVAYLADEVLPHAIAEEHTIYRVARTHAELEAAVAGMVEEHRLLAASVDRLARAKEGAEAATEAGAIGALFSAHVAKENDLVLPVLAADGAVGLPALLVDLHRLTEAARDETPASEDLVAPDTESALLALLLEATARLADAGDGDRACRLAATAWTSVRATRPDLAVRLTAALHRLVRAVTSEPVRLTDARRGTAGSSADAVLDVRALAPAQRHEKIFATHAALGPGTGFVLVNDHDPKPLRYQLEAEHAGAFTWDYLEEGPTVWRVRIGRPAGAAR